MARRPLRLTIVGSSGGSALAAAMECLRNAGGAPEVSIVVDRECGLGAWALAQAYPVARIPYENAERFSEAAANAALASDSDAVLLFYTRRVGAPLYARLPTYNVHPSLLPSFPGLHGLHDAMLAGSRVVGATLHLVTGALDGGPIVGQIANGIAVGSPMAAAEKTSFLQKVFLTLALCELLSDRTLHAEPATGVVSFSAGIATTLNASPALVSTRLRWAFEALQRKEGCRIVEAIPEPAA